MAQIKVNCRKVTDAAGQIDAYVTRVDRHMREINSTVETLGADWQGADYQQLTKEWSEIKAPGSTTDHMKQSLTNYADGLRAAARLYQEAQTRAINRANALCK